MAEQTLKEAFEVADTGAVISGELIPIDGRGKVRVTYNWLYSALNCVPNDSSSFSWVIEKVSGDVVALSPQSHYGGMKLYASVRPDNSYHVQVQAPFSADWITKAQGDEHITMTELGFLTVTFKGLNGQYMAVNGSESSGVISTGGSHCGYRLQSNASRADDATFFIAVDQVLQSKIALPKITGRSPEELVNFLGKRGVENFAQIALQVGR
ncbi:hypothetical protein [Pararhodospirillum oryzae]|uniref:Uncharacterized protein n=1 Tax=Pararhodospirillum oryzae TaxID=478448 RepID=A0A512H6P8_9PROT|nr:hypothetical protein [Pararhodospirillum oryzae]GEO81114.1 hypothetical protein ROR02_12450 [Pararhodospirillum oryzae]